MQGAIRLHNALELSYVATSLAFTSRGRQLRLETMSEKAPDPASEAQISRGGSASFILVVTEVDALNLHEVPVGLQ